MTPSVPSQAPQTGSQIYQNFITSETNNGCFKLL